MRRISKTKGPTNVAPAGQASCSIQAAEKQLKASLATADDRAKRARAHFDSLNKQEMRRALGKEQRGICVYCESRITDAAGIPPIEHWCPLSSYPELAIHWKNLYLSCSNEGTCDDTKAETRLAWDETDADLPWPADTSYEDWVGFTSGGEMYIRADAPIDDAKRRALALAIAEQRDGDRPRKAILNLNSDTLCEARKAAIDAERMRMGIDYRDRHATPEERKARAAAVLSENPYPPFVSIRVAYLKKMLGKNK